MKDIKARRGAFYLRRVVAEGEHERQDFKYLISDAVKIARSISAFANHSGGCLLIGVKDNGTIAGVRNEEDVYVVEQAAQLYCRPSQPVEFTAFTAEDGAIVIRAEIRPHTGRSVMARHADGSWHAYFRVADENILAPDLMVKAWERKNRAEDSVVCLTAAQRRLLSSLEAAGEEGASLPELMKEARMSESAASDTVTALYAMGVADFRFSADRTFRIVFTEPGDEPLP